MTNCLAIIVNPSDEIECKQWKKHLNRYSPKRLEVLTLKFAISKTEVAVEFGENVQKSAVDKIVIIGHGGGDRDLFNTVNNADGVDSLINKINESIRQVNATKGEMRIQVCQAGTKPEGRPLKDRLEKPGDGWKVTGPLDYSYIHPNGEYIDLPREVDGVDVGADDLKMMRAWINQGQNDDNIKKWLETLVGLGLVDEARKKLGQKTPVMDVDRLNAMKKAWDNDRHRFSK